MSSTSSCSTRPDFTFWEWMLNQEDWPAFDRLLFLVYGPKIMGVLRGVAELQLADYLKDGPREVTELAESTATQEEALLRLLRTSAALGVFRQQEDGKFTMTPEAEPLRSDVDSSLRDLVMFSGDRMLTEPFSKLADSVRSGAPAFEDIFGRSFYDYCEAEPGNAALFDRTMVQRSWLTARTLLRQIDLSPFRSIVDLGGGYGHFLGEALTQHPHLEAGLFERQPVLSKSATLLHSYAVGTRVSQIPGDFFEHVPEGYDVYLLNAVLNGLDDADAACVLSSVREAMGDQEGKRLFVFEKVMTGVLNEWDYSKLLDMDMLVLFGGKERTAVEWKQLLERTGFELLTPSPEDGSPWTALECRVAKANSARQD